MDYTKEIGWLLEEKYQGKKTSKFLKEVLRLKGGEPLSYIIGFVPFLGCKIDLSFRPLIPRAETEFWVEKAIAIIKKGGARSNVRCLDIFAGSGCIGIAVLKHLPNSQVDFGEKDPVFVKQIKRNLKTNNISLAGGRVIKSDVFSAIHGKYDYIFANPPYIAVSRKRLVAKSVINFEPAQALFAPDKGMFYIREFLQEAPKHLKENGIIFLEFDSWQKKEIEKVSKTLGYKHVSFLKDQYKKWRVAVIK